MHRTQPRGQCLPTLRVRRREKSERPISAHEGKRAGIPNGWPARLLAVHGSGRSRSAWPMNEILNKFSDVVAAGCAFGVNERLNILVAHSLLLQKLLQLFHLFVAQLAGLEFL